LHLIVSLLSNLACVVQLHFIFTCL
jgi:hypothetical protein